MELYLNCTAFFIFLSATTPAGIVSSRLNVGLDVTIDIKPFTLFLDESTVLVQTPKASPLSIKCDKFHAAYGIAILALLLAQNAQPHPFRVVAL